MIFLLIVCVLKYPQAPPVNIAEGYLALRL
ncbi:MAG: hypothetical protein JWR61_2272 [Ferruginibacter sp.]|nr:hypothetical protein [Ferruginibacter sp.]